MSLQFNKLFIGVIVESSVESISGPYLYSHTRHVDRYDAYGDLLPESAMSDEYETYLNKFAKIPVIGIIAGIYRMVLSIFHTLGHIVAYIATGEKGHKYHAIAGLCHLLRGTIETLPVIGRIFANTYGTGPRSWWMLKMYNPNKPDNFDKLIDEESVKSLEEYSLYIRA